MDTKDNKIFAKVWQVDENGNEEVLLAPEEAPNGYTGVLFLAREKDGDKRSIQSFIHQLTGFDLAAILYQCEHTNEAVKLFPLLNLLNATHEKAKENADGKETDV